MKAMIAPATSSSPGSIQRLSMIPDCPIRALRRHHTNPMHMASAMASPPSTAHQ